MPKDFDLNSEKWLALVFTGKNKEYGAYVQREESSDRHLKALAIITIIALGLIFLPRIIKSVLPEKGLTQTVGVETTVFDLDKNVPDENKIQQVNVPPPPELKTTVQFTPPVITKDKDIKDEELMKTQQELTETKADISVANVEGVQGGTVDIADLQEHKVVVEEQKPQIFNHVEVMPQFPGGEAALMKWLTENMTYPTIAAEQGIQGRVTLRFVVKPDGSIDEVEIQKSLDPSCDKEAIRVVKKMPKWIPGKQNGNPVYVYYSLPVTFRLQNS
ncbi:MAG: TonB family protein [Candidatus Azobacteroides sp.]|nr:TonB family protein [Candidatus Azobacteroides sp.]